MHLPKASACALSRPQPLLHRPGALKPCNAQKLVYKYYLQFTCSQNIVGLPHCCSIGRTAGLHCTDSGELEQAE